MQAEKLGVPKSPLTIRDCFEMINSGIRVNWRGELVVPEGTRDSDGYLVLNEATTDEAQSSVNTAMEAANSMTTAITSAAVAPTESESVMAPLLGGLNSSH